MGMPAAIIGGAALLGLGMSKMSGGSYGSMDYGNIQYQSPTETIPTAPEAPTNEDGSKSEAVLAAEEEERRRREAEAEANKTNHTGGLGVTTNPTSGKTLYWDKP